MVIRVPSCADLRVLSEAIRPAGHMHDGHQPGSQQDRRAKPPAYRTARRPTRRSRQLASPRSRCRGPVAMPTKLHGAWDGHDRRRSGHRSKPIRPTSFDHHFLSHPTAHVQESIGAVHNTVTGAVTVWAPLPIPLVPPCVDEPANRPVSKLALSGDHLRSFARGRQVTPTTLGRTLTARGGPGSTGDNLPASAAGRTLSAQHLPASAAGC